MGLAFKSEIDDIRESLAFKVKKAFERERAKVFLHDPYVPGYQNNLDEVLKDADVIFLATNHNFYKKIRCRKSQRISFQKLRSLRCLERFQDQQNNLYY